METVYAVDLVGGEEGCSGLGFSSDIVCVVGQDTWRYHSTTFLAFHHSPEECLLNSDPTAIGGGD